MASKDKKYQLSEGRKKQLEQARRNAKNASKQSKPASNYLGGSTKKTTNTTKKTSGTQSRNNTVSRSTGGKSTVTNQNVRQTDKVNSARPYRQSVRGLGNTVGITREGRQQKQNTLPKANAANRTSSTENTNRTTLTTRGTTMKQASTYLTGGNSSQSKTSSYAAAVRNGNTLPKASDDLRSRISAAQKQKENNLQRAMDTINANSVRWHSASPEEQTRLHNINNRIRQQYGMTYDDKLGNTYLPTASGDKNVSRPVNLMTGAAQPQTEFNSQEEKDARYIELQKEINRLNANYFDPTRKRFGLSDDKKADRDAKKQLVQVLKDEQKAMTGGTSRLTQALYSIGNRARAAIPSAYDTAIQHGKNAAKSQENPEYNKLAEQEQTLELQLAGMPSMDADGKVPAEYMEVYNQLQDVRKRKDALTDKTPVDQDKWSQRTLKKADEQQANATTGLTNGQKYAANTAISLAGNAPTMGLAAIPGVGPYLSAGIMGASAAGQRMYELNSQGVAPNESFARGLVSGGIEMATEKLPLENLADIIHKGGSGFIKNALRQAGIEATEESASYLANYAADLAANDPNAQFSLEELAQNAAGGAIGGLVFAGMGTGVNTLMTRAEAARNAYISPATQGAPQAPLNTGNGQMLSGAANTQTAPSLADARQQREALAARDISPKLTRAGAETAQADVQTAPAEITQRTQADEYLDQQDMPAAMSPADPETVYSYRYTNKDSPMSDYGHAMFVDDEYSSDGYGREGDYRYKVDQSRLTDISTLQEEIAEKLQEQYDNGMLPREIEEIMDSGVSAEQLAEEFNPDDIVMSAGAWDNGDLVQWFWDNIADPNDIYGIKTNDGAIVYDENMIEREDNPAQYVDTQQEAPTAQIAKDSVPLTEAMQYGKTPKSSVGAALGAQQAAQANDINPKLKKAGVDAESSVGAAQSGFDPYSKMVNDYGAIEPGMNPARTIDVPQSTNGTDRVSNVARTIMESGVTPENLIPALENHVAEGLFSHDVKSLKKTLSGATKTIQKKGWQGAFDQWEEVTDGRRAVTDDDIALGQMMYTAAVEAGDTQTAMKLAADLAVQGTALGRGVNAFKLLKKTTPEGQLYYLQKAVQRIQQEYQSRFDKQANKAAKKQGVPAEDIADQYGLKLNEDLVQEFLNAETEEARTKVVDKIYDDVAQQIPKTAGDRLNAWRYFAMLGNPRTHVRNVMGNVASAIALDASHKVSAAGQKFLPQDQRTRALHTSKAAKQFAKADYANVKAELTGNAYKTEMSEIKQRQKLFPKLLQTPMDKASELRDREDLAFMKSSYIKSMGNFLTARGWAVNNLTEAQPNEARQHAIEDAKIAAFQDASALADPLSQLEKRNKAWGVAIGSLVPFKRTPINVAKRSFELSPVGLLKAITYDAVQVKKGNMDATKMVDHISEGLTGSGIAALGAFLAAQGVFSAGSSDDDKEANLDAGMGQQEYAINIGGKSYTIDWAAPAVVPLAMGGELYNALQQKYDDDETAFNQAMATVSRMFDPMLNMTMLSGIGSTVTSAAYNKSNPLFGIASNVATNFGGQFVPTLFGQIARTVDNTRRTTYADKNSPIPSSVQKFMQRQANKIPGLSQNQPAYTDVWGREQKNGPDNVFARAAYNFFSPGYLADAKGTQTEKALKELYQATGDNSVLPSKPQKYYKTEDGTKKFLTAQEYSALTSEGGKIALDALGKLTKSEAYKGMTNDEKIEAVSDVYKYAKAVAANKTYGKELEGTIKTVKDSGIEPGLYYAYKEMEDSYNDSMESWEARDQTFNSIKGDKSLSEQEKNSLYHTLLIKGTSDSQWEKYQEISGKVTAEEYVDAMIQKQAITKEGETIEKGRAAQEATEFSYYLDAKGYSAEKRQALENTFKFYSMVKADPANYTYDMIRENGGAKEKEAIGEVESAGLTAPQYAQIKNATSSVTYEKGKTGAKKAAVAAVVSKNVENASQFSAVMHALGYKKIDGLYTSGGTLPEDKAASTGISVNRATGFSNPTKVSDAVITSGYGSRTAPTTNKGKGSKQHDGIDIGGSVNGQAADSIGGGKVTEVGYDENGYGNYVVVDHGDGYTSLYGHLQKATVKQGDTVSAGQQVGVIGSTGNSSGPHLHLRVHKNGQSIDPRTVIPGYGG
nr:MAG TPA: peptidase [Caudoviricetes sp.]